MLDLLALITDPNAWVALPTLIVMEVVLGVDNLVFVAILTNKLPETVRGRARTLGIGLALIMRLALLGTLVFLAHVTQPLFSVMGKGFSIRDLIMIGGGLFLLWKSTSEIREHVDPSPGGPEAGLARAVTTGFAAAILQIIVLDLVFSIDSILTAVGMTDQLPIMVTAVTIAVGLMLVASGPLAAFIRKNPTVVMLALGFLLMIGMVLIADGFGLHVPKGYIYAAMAFSALVETLNMLTRRKAKAQAIDPEI